MAAALVEVQSGQGGGTLLQPEDDEGPAFLLHRDGPELADGEGQRPPAPLVAVVDRDCGGEDGGRLGSGSSFFSPPLLVFTSCVCITVFRHKYNCDFQMSPLNSVKRVSRNSREICPPKIYENYN